MNVAFGTHQCDVCIAPCGGDRYHCQECRDFDLCPRCFAKKPKCNKGHSWFAHETLSDNQIKERLIGKWELGVGVMTYHALRHFKTRPCVGYPVDPEAQPPREYRWISYRDVHYQAMRVLFGLHLRLLDTLGADDARVQRNVDPNDNQPIRVAVFIKNSVDFVVMDVALAVGGFTSVPVDPHASKEAVAHILRLTACRAVIVDVSLQAVLQAVLAESEFESIVLVAVAAGPVSPAGTNLHERRADIDHAVRSDTWPRNVAVVALCDLLNDDLEARHAKVAADIRSSDFADLAQKRDLEEMFTLIFTSGSTGRPKGAMQTHLIWAQDTFELDLMGDPYVTVVYRPLCYATDREVLWRTLSNGGRVALFNSDMTTIFDDLPKIGPSSFSGPPRVWNVFYDRFHKELQKRLTAAGCAAVIAPGQEAAPDAKKIRRQLLEEYSQVVGKRCRSVGVGGAAPRPEVVAFMKVCFDHNEMVNRVYESYGTTENGGIAINGVIPPYVQVMLLDVPEMGFLTSNVPPQGEVLVITRDAIPGYWRDEENTSKLFHIDEKGRKWIKTGDIGEFRDGALVLIDRRANVVKLANSTFISPEHLEGVFLNATAVRDVFVYAESSWDFPLAVVTLSQSAQSDPSLATEANTLKQFRDLAATQDLNACHVPHAVLIEREWFTVENKSLTISLKMARATLKARYQDRLRELYAKVGGQAATAAHEDEPTMQRESSSMVFEHDTTGADTSESKLQQDLCLLYAKILQQQQVDPSESAKALGADSISIARIRERIKRLTKGAVDVSFELLWKGTIADVAGHVSKQLQAASQSPWDPRVPFMHGRAPNREFEATGASLKQRLEIDSAPVDFEALGDSSATHGEQHLLLTGATGFVGSHVLQQLLRSNQHKVTCLVRASDDTEALARLVAKQRDIQTPPTDFDTAVAKGTLNALAIPSDAHLRDVVRRLAEARPVTHVLHCSAAVNHVLPHAELSVANVESTRVLLSVLAAKGRPLRHFVLVSTVSAAQLSQYGSTERETLPMTAIPDSYLSRACPSGYATTKWCAERLVVTATGSAKSCFVDGCKASITRLGMTSWSTETGIGNSVDWLTALAAACAQLGVAPGSESAPRILNLSPVNAVARSLCNITFSAEENNAKPEVLHVLARQPVDIAPLLFTIAKSKAAQDDTWSEDAWVKQLEAAAERSNEMEHPPARRFIQAAAALFPSAASLPGCEVEVLSECRGAVEHSPLKDALSATKFAHWIVAQLCASRAS